LVVAFFRTCLVAAQPAIRHQLLTLKKTRPWFSLQPSAFSLQPSAFSLQPSAFSLQPSAFSFQLSAFKFQV
jgi:hypothetical protein